MKKAPRSSKRNKFPKGWDEKRVRRVIEYYENQTDAEAAAEDDAAFDETRHTVMVIPARLVPAVRKLLAKKAS